MSKVTRVIVLCPNGRRQNVNLTPNSSILQILEEVCRKQNVNPDDFDICHYNKPLDLSLPVRFANLSNNAQLELQPAKTARKDCLVTVALQLESGERIMKDFVPSTSVWDVVKECLDNKPDKTNLEQKGEPVCVYMRQKLIGDAMKETTLRGLGLTQGSAIIRLMYRNPEDLSDQAHISAPLTKPSTLTFSNNKLSTNSSEMECDSPVDKPETFNVPRNTVPALTADNPVLQQVSSTVEKESYKNSAKSEEKVTQGSLMKDISKKEEETLKRSSELLSKTEEKTSEVIMDQNMDIDSTIMDQDPPVEEIGAIHYVGGRHAVVYSLNDITDVKKADLPDEFFELTVDDVRYLMQEFKKTRAVIENQPLLTKELRNRQILQKLGRYKQTVIRVYFPERLVLQAVFEAQETVQDVCDFVRNYLEDKSLNFYLYTAPPKEKKDPAKSLIESMLIPAAVVYFGCEKQYTSYLLNSLKAKISDPRAAALAAYESRKQVISEDEEEISSEIVKVPTTAVEETQVDYKLPGPSFSQTSGSIRTSEKVPKWLKMSKK